MGTATAIRIMMMLMTIISSSSVKPRERRCSANAASDYAHARYGLHARCCIDLFTPARIYQSLYFVPSRPVPSDLV